MQLAEKSMLASQYIEIQVILQALPLAGSLKKGKPGKEKLANLEKKIGNPGKKDKL